MNANMRNVSRRSVTALIAISFIAMMLVALLPAAAIPDSNMGTVMGTVTDINNGEPIEDALVLISFHGTEMSSLTDEEGNYKFMNVPECFCLKTMKVTKDGYRPETDEVAIDGVTTVDFELLFMELEPYEGIVMGTVTDICDGQPMEDVRVELEYNGHVREVYTDSDGKYTFGQVPEGSDLIKVTATKEHYRPEAKEIAVSGETVVDFELGHEELPPLAWTLMGMVTDINTGSPIIGALVQLEYNDHIRETTTEADGLYLFEDVPEAWNPKHIKVSKEAFRPESKDIDVEGDTVADFQLMIEELPPNADKGTLSGVVVDANTGEPVEGTQMTLEYHEAILSVATDAEGRYTFTNVPVCYCLKDLSASKDGYTPQAMSIGIDEGTIQDISLVPEEEMPGPEDESPTITPGGSGSTVPDLGGILDLTLIALMVTVAGGALFFLITRPQDRS